MEKVVDRDGRFEGLTIGLVPAILAAGALIGMTFVAATAYFSVISHLQSMETQIRGVLVWVAADRWTRTDQEALCRYWERTKGAPLACPETLPKSVDIDTFFKEQLGQIKSGAVR